MSRWLLLFLVILIPLVSAVDIQVWQGKYLTGSANTVYTFNFTVYDDIIVGESCWSNTVDLTTDSDRWWYTDQVGVAEVCSDATINYYLNIEINGADQAPRRLLKELKYADLSLDNTFVSNVNILGDLNMGDGFITSNSPVRLLDGLKIISLNNTGGFT